MPSLRTDAVVLHVFDSLQQMFDGVDAFHINPKFVMQPGHSFCMG